MPASMSSGTYPRYARLRRDPFERALKSAWQFLQDLGARRARLHLLRLADQYEGRDPALARQMREVAGDS